ncbi:MAG: SRPBCC family protein [Solirubrobacteraceae bacterium]
MNPIQVSIDLSQRREAVYDFLDAMPHHELFTDHMMRDWHFEGPERGIGSKARVIAVLGGRTEPVEIEVIDAQPPFKSVERNTGAGGKRVATGTYTLTERPDGGSHIVFEYAWQKIPRSERLAAPIIRSVMRRAAQRALQRLAEQLQALEVANS